MKSITLLCVAAACVFAGTIVESGVVSPRFTLSFNSAVDTLLASIKNNATGYVLDPYNVQDINDTFKAGLIKGGLYLDNGHIYGISTVYRTGNATVDLQVGQAIINVSLGFMDLKYTFDFAAKIGVLGPRGKVHGEITNLFIDAGLLANTKNTSDVTATLQTFKLNDKGEITIHFDQKDPVAEDILDSMTDLIAKIFKNVIFKLIEKDVGKAANNALSQLHFSLGSLIG